LKNSILKKIESLPSLSSIVIEINDICSDSKSSLQDVANIVKKDPISTATILKRVNSPLYGIMNNVTTIDKAVTMLGKASTKAFILENAIKDSFKIDLSAYNMSESDFSIVAQKRTSLMIKWYSKVSFSRLNILATSAVISNIGQILISKEILELNKKEEFLETMEDSSTCEAELELVGVTSEEVTAYILDFWNFDTTLIDSIKYSSCNNSDFEHNNSKPYILANYAIHKIIDSNGKINEDNFDEIKLFLDKNSMNSESFFESLDIIRKFNSYD
jgi:HD-like signal output (HDOD) protein